MILILDMTVSHYTDQKFEFLPLKPSLVAQSLKKKKSAAILMSFQTPTFCTFVSLPVFWKRGINKFLVQSRRSSSIFSSFLLKNKTGFAFSFFFFFFPVPVFIFRLSVASCVSSALQNEELL